MMVMFKFLKFLTISAAYPDPGHENKNILPLKLDTNPK
jgi:hypothetical protein